MNPNKKKLLEYIIGSISQPIFALVFQTPDGERKYRYLDGTTALSDDIKRDRLASYQDARNRAKELRDDGQDVSIAAYYQKGRQTGWIPLPTGLDLQIQSQAKPFTPFADESAPSIAFPIESLANPYRAYVQAASESFQVDSAMVCCCVLAVFSAIFQRCGFSVRVNQDWIEPCNLFLTCTASPSERKSPVLRDVTHPLTDMVTAWNEKNADAIAWQTQRIDVLRRKVENLTTKLAKGVRGATEDDLKRAQTELRDAEREQIKPQTWLVDDTTPEALALVLRENNESAALLSGEAGSCLGILAGRYSAPGTGANLDLFLKGYSVEPTVIHRIGRQTVNLNSPRLTILLMSQPNLLREFVGNDSFSGRGLCARFLYAFPSSLVGHRAFRSEPIPTDVRIAFESKIKALADIALNWELEETTLTVSTDALEVLGQFHDAIEPQRPEMSDALQAWSGKLEGNIVRISALLYLSEHSGKTGAIDADTMRRAVEIGRYFQTQAQYALGLSADSPARKSALLILKQFENPQFQQYRNDGFIRKRDLYMKVRGKDFKTISDLDVGLKELCDNGYTVIANDDFTESGKVGRPSPKVFFTKDYVDYVNKQ